MERRTGNRKLCARARRDRSNDAIQRGAGLRLLPRQAKLRAGFARLLRLLRRPARLNQKSRTQSEHHCQQRGQHTAACAKQPVRDAEVIYGHSQSQTLPLGKWERDTKFSCKLTACAYTGQRISRTVESIE